MLRKKHLISVVTPVLNEEESIPQMVRRLLELGDILSQDADIELLFIDDGSTDQSLQLLRHFASQNKSIKVISFSRNFGHQIAITAGIDFAMGDFVAVIDADLQDPPELIMNMYQMALHGYDVIHAKRRSRAGETLFKKASASAFYRTLNYMCESNIPSDTGDFRLMSRVVVDAFKQMRERHRFVRGMIPWLGFRSYILEYDREERFAGKTKYPLKKMMSFAMSAIMSFSSKPLTLAIRLGLLTILISIICALYMLYLKFFTNNPIPGLTAILLSIAISSGIQILLIGIIGAYIANIFEEVKGRPLYLIAEFING